MVVWLENAYSRPFWGFFGAHFSQMLSLIILTPKRTILGLNHGEYFSYRFFNGPFKSHLHVFPIGLTLRGPQKWVFGGYKYGGVNILNLSSLWQSA